MTNTFTKSALVLAAALVAGSSFAADTGAVTREQVRAEFNQARANGTLPANGEGQTAIAPKVAPSTLTRQAVQAEYFAARAAGTLAPTGEGQEAKVAVAPSVASRDAVRAEFYAARKAGTLPKNGEGDQS
jgi:hypothetical protein